MVGVDEKKRGTKKDPIISLAKMPGRKEVKNRRRRLMGRKKSPWKKHKKKKHQKKSEKKGERKR